jgi:hypothetical protein
VTRECIYAALNLQAKTHFLVIPKIRAGLTQLSKADEGHKALLGRGGGLVIATFFTLFFFWFFLAI